MSSGRLDAWTLPALWYVTAPSEARDTAIDAFVPSPAYTMRVTPIHEAE